MQRDEQRQIERRQQPSHTIDWLKSCSCHRDWNAAAAVPEYTMHGQAPTYSRCQTVQFQAELKISLLEVDGGHVPQYLKKLVYLLTNSTVQNVTIMTYSFSS